MKTYTERGTAIGELVERKNAAYGDSITRTGELLRILYPEGLRPEQYDDLALQVRIFDKQMRIATDRDALGESPYEDIAGYGILGADMQQKKKEASAPWQGNANGPDAANSSRNGTPDSTPQSASARTGPSATERTAPEPSPQPDGCSEPFPAATAATVTAPASPSAEGRRELYTKVQRISWIGHTRELWLSRDNCGLCVACAEECGRRLNYPAPGMPALRVCTPECWEFCSQRVISKLVQGVTS